MSYETAARGQTGRNYPESWGRPVGRDMSAERRDWVARNIRSNPRFKLDQLASQERRALRAEIENIDNKLRGMGITPPPLDDF